VGRSARVTNACLMIYARIAIPIASVALLTGIAISDAENWTITPLVGTDVGLDVAAGVQVEGPFRLRLAATAGWLPNAYAWGAKKYFVDALDGRKPVGELLEELIEQSFVFGTTLTARPFWHHGFFAGIGYHLVIADKTGLLIGQIENALDERAPAGRVLGRRTFETKVRAHMGEALIGWQWGLGRGFTLLATIGVIKIMSTSTTFEPEFTPADPIATKVFTNAASRLVEGAGEGTFIPSSSLFLGYNFR